MAKEKTDITEKLKDAGEKSDAAVELAEALEGVVSRLSELKEAVPNWNEIKDAPLAFGGDYPALAVKISAVSSEIGRVPKDGYNAFHNYAYVTESTLVETVRDHLTRVGVALIESTYEQDHKETTYQDTDKNGNTVIKRRFLTTCSTVHLMVDGESGGWIMFRSQGQGEDIGDKGIYKAITGAQKYALSKTFMVPSEDDPERDAHEGLGGGRHTKTQPRKDEHVVALDYSIPGMWRNCVKHFAKHVGKTLGEIYEIDLEHLDWMANDWKAKPFQGKVDQESLEFRKALDQYKNERDMGNL